MAIERELWLEMIKEGLVPDTFFLLRSVCTASGDMDLPGKYSGAIYSSK